MSRVRLAVALVVALILAAACSAPVDSGPKTIRPASIPVGLGAETSSTTTTTVPASGSEEVTVYFIGRQDERLQPVKRRVSSPVTPKKVLEKLFAGPSDAEAVTMRTAISGDTRILGADIKDTIITIDTSKNFAFGLVPDQIAAFAQVVFTALDLDGVTGVQFAQNGRRIPAQAGDGSSETAPLGRALYSDLAPR